MDWNTMEYFDDNFDILDDTHDLVDLKTDELNRYFLEGHLNSIMDYEEEEEEMIEDDHLSDQNDVESLEEEILSQKLSQLSTKTEEEEEQNSFITNKKRRLSTTSNPDVISKKMKMTTDGNDDDDDNIEKEPDQIPTYLLATNESFIHLVQKVINDGTSSISMNDLQQVALLIHHMAVVHIQKQVSIIYYKSGTGTLKDSEPELVSMDRRVWPVQVKSAMLAKQGTSDATPMEINLENEHLACEKLVCQRFQEMDEKTEQYQNQFDEKKSQLIGFTSTMEETIRNYVYLIGIKPLKIKRDLKIALLKHDYDAEIIERKFLRENPNEYQIQVAKRLYETRNEFEKSRRELLELKQRVFYNKPLSSYNSVQTSILTSIDTTTTTMTNDNNQQQQQQQFLLNKHEKLIQRKKLDLMAIHMLRAEVKFYQCQKAFDDKLSQMRQNHRNLVQDKGMPTALSNLIEQRFTNITDRWRDIYNFRINYHLQNPYDDWDAIEKKKNDNEPIMKTIGFQPRMIIDTPHSLTDKQIQLLNRGPTYVPPCQMHISSSCQSIDDIIKKQYAPLKHQLAWLFTKYKVNVALQFTIPNEIYDQFKKFFSMSIPYDIQKRALYEKKLVQTIRQSLKKNDLILRRTADNMNTFYLGNSQEFEIKADDYLTKTDVYKVLFAMNEENNEQQLHIEVNEMIESINFALGILKRRNAIAEELYNRLLIDATKVKLPYLYFLPDVSKENDITLKPVITSQHNVTHKISKYLDQLLRPFANEKMKSLTFADEAEFIQTLNGYVYTGHHLTSTTMFCTIKISNYSTLDSHENMIIAVCNFLQDHLARNKLEQISIMTIKNLLQLCLYNNIFCYKDKIYTFTKGGPTSSRLTDTLSNIYIFQWQEKIVDEMRRKKELFGRYKDQIFFTWNGSSVELRTFLQLITQKHPNVRVQTLIGLSVQFLNAYIENRDGQLYSRVYRDPTIQGYILPYVVGHSKVKHSDWIRSALIQAVCYCSSVHDFNQQRIYIELTCLVNGYSFVFVESRIVHFYDYFRAATLQYDMDQKMYDKFRRQWFDFIDMQRALSTKLQKFDDNDHLIRFNYLYEVGSRCQFNEEFHKLWIKHFGIHPILRQEKMGIILTSKHLHSLNALLAQQKLFCWI